MADDKAYGRAWREASRKVERLASHIARRLNQITTEALPKTDGDFAPQTAVDWLATELMEKDEQLFIWLLESQAAQKIYQRKDAEINLHPQHPTAN